jgi:hypothetical protein
MNPPVSSRPGAALSRPGAACGAVFAVVLFAANGNGNGQFSGPRAVAGLAALTLAIPFIAYLCVLLWSAASDGDRWLAGTAAGAGIAWATLKLSSGAAELTLTAPVHIASGSSLGSALDGLGNSVTVISLYPLAIFCAAVAILALRTRALPRWLAIGAAITAVALAVNGCFLATDNVPAMLLFVLWSLLTSGYLLWMTRRGIPAAVATASDSNAEPALR